MEYTNINPGLKTDMRQAYTITMSGQIFFVTHNERYDTIEWNMYSDDDTKQKVEKILRIYLTNR